MTSIVALAALVAALFAAPAQGAQRLPVVVVTQEALDDADGAQGLLVPDAGPRTSRARALVALERGEVRNSLLGERPPGEPLIEVTFAERVPEGPAIVLSLPAEGTRRNDARYPIAVVAPGYDGLLTSDSTRIPGLVSIVDVAPTALGREGRLGSAPEEDPAAALWRLEDQISHRDDHKAAMLLVALPLLAGLALVRRKAILPGLAAILLANLVLSGQNGHESFESLIFTVAIATVILVAAALLFARLPLVAHALLLVGVLAAYLVAMAVDASSVALSPLGPVQNARFYGLSNLLATLLLVPALAAASILGRAYGIWAFGAVAALSLVMVGGSQFGADGGGVIVLLVAYALLLALEGRLSRRALLVGAAVMTALAVALAAGGETHVTDALRDGPTGLAEDLARRLELSWYRATGNWGAGLIVFGGIAVLAVLALRERRPLVLSYLAAIGVSLLVNDSPHDVVVAGLAGYLALSTAPGVARPAGERATPAAPEPTTRTAPAASP